MSATRMPIATTCGEGEVWGLSCIGLGESPRPREKQSPDGRATFTTGCVLRVAAADGTIRAQKAASINVIEAAAVYEAGTAYVGQGLCWVTPYTPDGGRSTLSILVERLVPEAEGQAVVSSRRRSEPSG